MAKAYEVARYILGFSEPDAGDAISNLKLQKLLYYVQGFHLAIFNEPLFEEPIKAWEHGPVVEEVYFRYKDFGANAIVDESDIEFTLSEPQKEMIADVYNVYGQFSAWKLRNMTHDEMPWGTTPKNAVISHEKLYQHFSAQVIQ